MSVMKIHRMKSIEESKGWLEFYELFNKFVKANNFSFEQHQIIMHAMNSMYFMGYPIEDSFNRNECKNESS